METILRRQVADLNDEVRRQEVKYKLFNQKYASILEEKQSLNAEVDASKRQIKSMETAYLQLEIDLERQSKLANHLSKEKSELLKKNLELTQAIDNEKTYSRSVRQSLVQQRSASPPLRVDIDASSSAVRSQLQMQLKNLEEVNATLHSRLEDQDNARSLMWQAHEGLVSNHRRALNDLTSQLMDQEAMHAHESHALQASINARDAVIRNLQETITNLNIPHRQNFVPPPFSIELNDAPTMVLGDLRNVQRDIHQRTVVTELRRQRDPQRAIVIEELTPISGDDEDDDSDDIFSMSNTSSEDIRGDTGMDVFIAGDEDYIYDREEGGFYVVDENDVEVFVTQDIDPSTTHLLPLYHDVPVGRVTEILHESTATTTTRSGVQNLVSPHTVQPDTTQIEEGVIVLDTVVVSQDVGGPSPNARGAQFRTYESTIDNLRELMVQVVNNASFSSHELSHARDGLIDRDAQLRTYESTIDNLRELIVVLGDTVVDLQRQLQDAGADALHSWELPNARADVIARDEIISGHEVTILSLRGAIVELNRQSQTLESRIDALQNSNRALTNRISNIFLVQAASRGEVSMIDYVNDMDDGGYG